MFTTILNPFYLVLECVVKGDIFVYPCTEIRLTPITTDKDHYNDFVSKTWFALTHTHASFKFLDYIDMFDFVDPIKIDYAHWNVDITPFSISDFLGADAAFRFLVWQLNTCSLHLRLVSYLTISTTTSRSTCTSCMA